MNRIDRYIIGLFLSFFFGALVVFITMYLAFDAMNMMMTYVGISLPTWVLYYAYSLPDVLAKMIPVACLLATMFTLSSLNRANELVALFASGMSLMRVASPVFIIVIIISVFSYFVGDRLLPVFAREKNFVFYRDIVKNPSLYSTTKADKIWYRSHDRIFNIKTLNEKTNTAQGLTLYYFSEAWDLLQMVTATNVDLQGEKWQLHNGSVTVFTQESSFPVTSQFKEKTIIMGEDSKDLSSSGNTSEVLNQAELSEFIDRNRAAGLDTLSYEVSYHSKFGFAFAALVMSLLAVPFSVTRGRSGSVMLNIGMGLGVVVVYWIFYSSGLTLGNHGRIPPIAAAWLPNMIMGAVALLLLRRLSF